MTRTNILHLDYDNEPAPYDYNEMLRVQGIIKSKIKDRQPISNSVGDVTERIDKNGDTTLLTIKQKIEDAVEQGILEVYNINEKNTCVYIVIKKDDDTYICNHYTYKELECSLYIILGLLFNKEYYHVAPKYVKEVTQLILYNHKGLLPEDKIKGVWFDHKEPENCVITLDDRRAINKFNVGGLYKKYKTPSNNDYPKNLDELKEKSPNIIKFLNYITDDNGDSINTNSLIYLLSFKLKNLSVCLPRVIYLLGIGGSGKGTFIGMLDSLTGSSSVETMTQGDEINSSFNDLFIGKCWGNLNEIYLNNKQHQDRFNLFLKVRTSNEPLVVNSKHKDKVVVNLTSLLIVTSNNTSLAHFEKDSRRDIQYIQNKTLNGKLSHNEDKEHIEFFKFMNIVVLKKQSTSGNVYSKEEINNNHELQHFYDFLRFNDLKECNELQEIVVNDAKQMLINNNKSPLEDLCTALTTDFLETVKDDELYTIINRKSWLEKRPDRYFGCFKKGIKTNKLSWRFIEKTEVSDRKGFISYDLLEHLINHHDLSVTYDFKNKFISLIGGKHKEIRESKDKKNDYTVLGIEFNLIEQEEEEINDDDIIEVIEQEVDYNNIDDLLIVKQVEDNNYINPLFYSETQEIETKLYQQQLYNNNYTNPLFD